MAHSCLLRSLGCLETPTFVTKSFVQYYYWDICGCPRDFHICYVGRPGSVAALTTILSALLDCSISWVASREL